MRLPQEAQPTASSTATTADEYLASLPPERRAAMGQVRNVILGQLPDGFREGMYFGMLGYFVPLERYPDTYNGQPLGIAALASQKHHMSLYLMSVYGDREIERWFRDAWAATGTKLDMGKSCIRFKKVEDLPLELIGQTIARVSVDDDLAHYEAARRR